MRENAMESKYKTVAFSRMVNRHDSVLAALFLSVLCGALMWAMLASGEAGEAFFALFLGLFILGIDGWLLYWGLTTVTVSLAGIALTFGTYVLKHLPADEIQTVLKVTVNGKGYQIIMLRCLSVPVDKMEAKGEQKLSKNRFMREEIKFRRNKSDWKDVCLKAGLPKCGGLWMEFSPERLQFLQEMFPSAAYREPKRYDEPPSLV